jgi:ABC-type transport system substrate-binding protein
MDKSEATTRFLKDQQVPLNLSSASGRVGAADTLDVYMGSTAYLNAGKYAIPGFDEAINAARATTDRDQQKKFLSQAQQAASEAMIGIELVHPPYAVALRNTLTGYQPSLVTIPKFATIHFKK